ncbi:MAG TPA: hypothetical protein VLF60_00750 [Candidatus Saccharimonadales bacterium]|nr:hypothetical protein [Candidatus Saccharimonadales bacterium]
MKLQHRHRAIISISFLLLVGIVSGGVFVVRHHPEVKNTQGNPSMAQPPAAPNAPHLPAGQNGASTVDPQYVTIKEWGVRFKPASGLGSVQYKAINGQNVLGFTTNQLAALDPGCALTGEPGSAPLGWLERSATPLQAADGTPRSALKTLGGYSYYFTGPQATCLSTEATDTPQNEQLTGQQALLLAQSLDSIEAIQ